MFDVRSDAACGTPLKLNYVGTVDAASSSMAPLSLVDTTAGGGGTCHVANGCNTSLPAPITLADGVYFNASRSGNGEGVFTIPIAGSERPTVFSAWFTGSPDRTPTWYIVQDFVQDNQMVAPVYRFQQDVASPTFKVSKRAAGTAQMTWLAPSKFAFTWNLGGVRGGQIEQRAYQLSPATVPNRTGAWFYAAEGGWGQVIDDHFLPPLTQSTDEVAINYLYDSAGNPRWNLGDVGTLDTGTIPLTQFQVHCPSCPKLVDFLTVNASAGTLTRNYTSVTTGVLSTQITFQPPLLGNWNRTSIPIQMISVPPAQIP
jgi:hypothetical protein